jgi:murein DD-endopeptidase MepM/ murein hydrolase activator NlpD
VRHTLRRGQTLYSLARSYDIPLNELMAANGISDPRLIPDGTQILIPGARVRLPYRPAAAAGDHGGPREPGEPGNNDRRGDGRVEAAVAAADGGATTDGDATGEGTRAAGSGGDGARGDDEPGDGEHHGDGAEAPGERHAVRADPADSLQWPLHGVITGAYGRRGRKGHHAGIDIDGQRGDPILAAAPGVVVSAGTDGPYGRRVEIDHGDGIVTLYAHADRLLVHTGDQVRAGQRIAEVGRSGNARGTHLHFEVRRQGRAVDPLPYLRDDGLLTAGVN